jgi:hypothetical protein
MFQLVERATCEGIVSTQSYSGANSLSGPQTRELSFSSGLLQMAQGRMQCLRTLNDDSESETTDLLAGGKKDRARRFRIVGPVGITI